MGYVTGGPWSTNLNPLSPTSAWASSASAAWTFNYEPLLQYNFGDPSEVTPWLATKYEWGSDSKSLTFTIRDGVKWSDGKPFTAEDVAYTFDLIKRVPALNSTGIEFNAVSMPTADTVKLTFDKKNIPALFYISTVPIVPKHVFEAVKDPSNFLNSKPVVTGPYTVASITPQVIQLVRNPTYWGTKPAVEKIAMPALYTNAAASAALTSGQAQWGDAFMPNFKQYLAASKSHKYQYPAMSDVFLVPNIKKYPLNLTPLRKAISMAVDRKTFSQAAVQGQEPPVETATGFLLPRDESTIAPEYKDAKLTTDLAGAKKLLTDAGFTYQGDQLFAPNGERVSLALEVNGGFSDWVGGGPTVVTALKSLGIDSKMTTPSQTQFFSDLSLGKFDLTIWTSFTSGPGPFYQFDQFLNSSKSAPVGKAAVSNYGRWENAETDKYLDEYASASDDAAKTDALHGIQKVMVEQSPVIPLIYQVAWAQYSDDKFTGWPATEKDGWACNWCAPTNERVLLNLKPVQGSK
jgi:peptide/nickel transport system substrate-binding protein